MTAHEPRGRLAPSPTGAQHIGNARTYLLAWLAARSRGGRLVLRIEDIDSPRVKAGAARQALDDLHWLGLDWDEGPDVGGENAPYIQTERLPLYQQALEELKQAERIYPCTCTRTDVAAAASAPHVGQEPPPYPGTCSFRSAKDAASLDQSFSWRFRTTNRARTFIDVVHGEQRCNVAGELGDFVVAKADGSPSYQLAVVVDDLAMGITQVVRGDDLLPSAFRQLELYEFFHREPPEFAHVPLVIGPDGRRLAKRHGDTRIATLRAAGVSQEKFVGFLAWSSGLIDSPISCTPQDLLSDFNLHFVLKSAYVFTNEMLLRLTDD